MPVTLSDCSQGWNDCAESCLNGSDSIQRSADNLYNSTNVEGANEYLIELEFDHLMHMLRGNTTLYYTNKGNISFDSLYFHIYPNAFSEDGGLTEIMWAKDGEDTPLSYEIMGDDSTILEVRLPTSLEPGERTVVKLNYEISIPQTENRFGWTNDTYNFGNCLPIISLWDDKDSWNNDLYFERGESFNSEFSFYNVALTVPDEFTVAATGSTLKTVHNTNSTKTIYYETGLVREFAFVASKNFEVMTDSWENITINSYYFPEDEKSGRKALDIGMNAIKLFSEHFERYPYGQFNVVETYLGGGMEYPNLVMIGAFFYKPEYEPYLESLIAHETAHQWIPFLVGSDQNDEPWLDEAFAVYSDLLYHEWVYGRQMKELLLGRYRQSYYQYGLSERDGQVGADVWSTTSMAIYYKGAIVLEMLRWVVGDEIFFDILSNFCSEHKFKLTRAEDFIATAENISGQELGWFFDEWLFSEGCVSYTLEEARVTETRPGEYLLHLNISQSKPSFKMPVPVEIGLKNHTARLVRVWMEGDYQTFTFNLDSEPRYIILDPRDVIFGVDKNNWFFT